MKGNNGKGNNTTRDEWETPQEIFNILNKQYNFCFDCCSNGFNFKCSKYSSDFEKETDIFVTSWMNPPFSKASKMFEHFFRIINRGVAIYRCDNVETKIWQELIFKKADWIFFPKGRVSYYLATENANGIKGSRFPSALIGIGLKYPIGLDGTLVKVIKQ